MAASDITITAANVIFIGSTSLVNRNYNASTAITAGQMVSLNSGDEWQLADANNTEETAGSLGYGMALNDAANDQPLNVLTGAGAEVAVGAVLTQWQVYIISDTAGKLCLATSLASGFYPTIFGYAKDTSTLVLIPRRIPGALA